MKVTGLRIISPLFVGFVWLIFLIINLFFVRYNVSGQILIFLCHTLFVLFCYIGERINFRPSERHSREVTYRITPLEFKAAKILGFILSLIVIYSNIMLIYRIDNYIGIASIFSTVGKIDIIQRSNVWQGLGLFFQLASLASLLLAIWFLTSKNKLILLIWGLGLILQFIRAILMGQRLAFLEWLLPMIATYFFIYRKPFSLIKFSFISISSLVFIITLFAYGELIRRHRSINDSLLLLWNYYAQSVNNAAYIVVNDNFQGVSGGFWSFSSLLSFPLAKIAGSYEMASALGVKTLHERQDYFNFARSIGIDPEFNTYSIYGFTMLDFGVFYTILFTMFLGIICGYIFKLVSKGYFFALPIYIGLCMASLDMLRTFLFSGEPFFYLALATLVFYTIHISIINNPVSRVRKLFNRKHHDNYVKEI